MKMKILLAFALIAAAPASTVKLRESGQAKVGRAAPSFGGWDLSRKNVLTLDKLRRSPALSPLLITFGASWCKPCNEGLPRLRALTRKRPELRLVLVDVESDGAVAQEWAARLGIDGPAILDMFDEVAKTYGVVEGEKKMLPRTCATVPAPEVPPAQACANRCTVTSHFSPRLPSEQFSSGSTSSWVASVISFFSRLAQEAPSGRIPRRLTVLTT